MVYIESYAEDYINLELIINADHKYGMSVDEKKEYIFTKKFTRNKMNGVLGIGR